MKLIEALKKLRVIKKKQIANTQAISNYSSSVSSFKPAFGDDESQKKEVMALVQSNLDLTNEYLKIKRQIEITNLFTKVTIFGKEYSLEDLLILKRELIQRMDTTYKSLTDTTGKQQLQGLRNQSGDGHVSVVCHYDERDRINGIKMWQELKDEIDSRLEVINATIDLVDESSLLK